jgi:SpoVK/Ycf46/Vps4 family AAA+-type ATPase
MRIESPVQLQFEPVYAPPVDSALLQVVAEHERPERLTAAGLYPVRTVLLNGPPGVGKTLAARWVAEKLHQPLFVVDLGTIMSRFLGATGANLKRALAYARESSGVVLLDELDALAKRRDDASDVGELKRLVTVLLQELDDWPSGRLLFAATNHPALLDDAVWRRFEVRIDFPTPSESALSALLPRLVPADAHVPRLWSKALPLLYAGSSQSEFVRALQALRKAAVLDPDATPASLLERIVGERTTALSRDQAKRFALALSSDGTLSQRQIAQITHVSRDTLRRSGAGKQGA